MSVGILCGCALYCKHYAAIVWQCNVACSRRDSLSGRILLSAIVQRACTGRKTHQEDVPDFTGLIPEDLTCITVLIKLKTGVSAVHNPSRICFRSHLLSLTIRANVIFQSIRLQQHFFSFVNVRSARRQCPFPSTCGEIRRN